MRHSPVSPVSWSGRSFRLSSARKSRSRIKARSCARISGAFFVCRQHREIAMDISLCCLHTKKAPLIRAHDLALIRDRDFRADDKRKLMPDQLTGDTGECRIRHFLATDPGVEKTADFQVVVLFVLDVYVRDLLPCALVSKSLFIGPRIDHQ